MKNVIYLVLAGMCSSHSFTLDHRAVDEILSFNVGGYCFDTTAQSIKASKIKYLISLISSDFGIKYDKKWRIFIDRSKAEGKIIEHYLHYQSIPQQANYTVVLHAADFFGLPDPLRAF